MKSPIEAAIELRKAKKYEESRSLLLSLLANEELAAPAQLHIAWSYDNQGMERDAVEHYKAALSGRLSKAERYEALFGLGSTLRSLGEYARAAGVLKTCIAEYPDSQAPKAFYAMCLYNLGQSKEAVQYLLKLLVQTSSDEEMLRYAPAISSYAEDLDRIH